MERIFDKNKIGVVWTVEQCYSNTQKQELFNCSWEDRQKKVPSWQLWNCCSQPGGVWWLRVADVGRC